MSARLHLRPLPGYNDFVPFYARVGDTWTKIDYSQDAAEWMKPLERGQEVDLVEIGAQLVRRRPAADDVHQEGA